MSTAFEQPQDDLRHKTIDAYIDGQLEQYGSEADVRMPEHELEMAEAVLEDLIVEVEKDDDGQIIGVTFQDPSTGNEIDAHKATNFRDIVATNREYYEERSRRLAERPNPTWLDPSYSQERHPNSTNGSAPIARHEAADQPDEATVIDFRAHPRKRSRQESATVDTSSAQEQSGDMERVQEAGHGNAPGSLDQEPIDTVKASEDPVTAPNERLAADQGEQELSAGDNHAADSDHGESEATVAVNANDDGESVEKNEPTPDRRRRKRKDRGGRGRAAAAPQSAAVANEEEAADSSVVSVSQDDLAVEPAVQQEAENEPTSRKARILKAIGLTALGNKLTALHTGFFVESGAYKTENDTPEAESANIDDDEESDEAENKENTDGSVATRVLGASALIGAGGRSKERLAQAKHTVHDFAWKAYEKLKAAERRSDAYFDHEEKGRRRKIVAVAGVVAVVAALAAAKALGFDSGNGSARDAMTAASPPDTGGASEGSVAPDTSQNDVPSANPEQTAPEPVALEAYDSRTGAGTVEGAALQSVEKMGINTSDLTPSQYNSFVNELRTETLELNGWTEAEARKLQIGQSVELLDRDVIERILADSKK